MKGYKVFNPDWTCRTPYNRNKERIYTIKIKGGLRYGS